LRTGGRTGGRTEGPAGVRHTVASESIRFELRFSIRIGDINQRKFI